MRKKVNLKILMLILIIVCLPIVVFADEEIVTPEYTEEFKQWLALPEEEREKYMEPPMYENPYDDGIQLFSEENNEMLGSIVLPSNFARDDYGAVRNQTSNSCWAESAATVFENNYSITTGKKARFSSVFMDYITSSTYNPNGFYRRYNTGGNMYIALAYATNGMGIALDESMPTQITTNTLKSVPTVAKVSDYDVISDYEIKQYVYQYGVVSIQTYVNGRQYFSSANLFNNQDLAYYCDEPHLADHAVTIVGWDDNYTNSAFPGERGAYLVLNSYGTGFGNNGLYHIFYNDYFVQDSGFQAVTKTEDKKDYKLYQYDEYGVTGYRGFQDPRYPDTYCANVFSRENNVQERLREISLYFPTDSSLTVYINANGDDKNIDHATTVFETGAKKEGYHTIAVPGNVVLTGNKFTVAVKYNGMAPVELEANTTSSYAYTVTSNLGESFISHNGKAWIDFKANSSVGCNATIKAFTEEFEYAGDLPDYAFDYKYYADHNLDLYIVFGYNEPSLRQHWLTSGIKEGRRSSAIFDVKCYLAANEDLRNAFGNNYEAAYYHFLNRGYAEFRTSSIEYSGYYYKTHNPDLANLTAMQLIRHYISHGKIELRRANVGYDVVKYTFDPSLYAYLYPDVVNVVGTHENDLRNHWYRYGIPEGRIASLIFDAKYYMNQNPDVANAYSAQNYLCAYIHFTDSGFTEGRQGSKLFSIRYYLDKNEDVKNAFQSNYLQALNHFVYRGKTEKRKTSTQFDVMTYKQKNPDVANAFGDDIQMYYLHYITHGQKENRPCI